MAKPPARRGGGIWRVEKPSPNLGIGDKESRVPTVQFCLRKQKIWVLISNSLQMPGAEPAVSVEAVRARTILSENRLAFLLTQ